MPKGPEYVGRVVRISGLVQGVGFRPFIWRIASEMGLSGHVLNNGQGVEIEVWGVEDVIEAFVAAIGCDTPPLSRIDQIQAEPLATAPAVGTFRIVESQYGDIATGVVADAATCASCLDDIFDPSNRRFRYPFTNCTHCGPRLSIVKAIPYDRAHTSMAAFKMCSGCQAEYDRPDDRRFHAQPNACPVCGPKLWLEDRAGPIDCHDAILRTAELIAEGAIVAIKGIGGFHLACDATNELAVAELRRRKRRPHKPLALMARDPEMVRKCAAAGESEIELLCGPAAPIVVLSEVPGSALAASIAPWQDSIGFMLPYTPLHHLLTLELDSPIVLTSGNLTDEPQVIANDVARVRLAPIADYWLMNDRDIVTRVDDSVMRVDVSGPVPLRRARGLAPEPLRLSDSLQDASNVLAMGGELKSTLCLLQNGQAILSQHIGDLEDPSTHADYRKSLRFYLEAFGFEPSVVAVDKHPDYLSTQMGAELARQFGTKVVGVQHHHAHMSSCLADNLVPLGEDRAVGVILDGLGFGDDGTIWGGEIFHGGYSDFTREGHFLPVALPGGEMAMREPWRNAIAHLYAAFGENYQEIVVGTGLGEFLNKKKTGIIHQAIKRSINAPLASSAGRLFDAVAAMLGVCREMQSFEGQAAMRLEVLARPHVCQEAAYPVETSDGQCRVLSWQPMWHALLSDLKSGVDIDRIAARFHRALIVSIADVAASVAVQRAVGRIVLSGGVMQNRILLEGLFTRLTGNGFEVLTHRRVPANDGGLSLGQAITASTCKRK